MSLPYDAVLVTPTASKPTWDGAPYVLVFTRTAWDDVGRDHPEMARYTPSEVREFERLRAAGGETLLQALRVRGALGGRFVEWAEDGHAWHEPA